MTSENRVLFGATIPGRETDVIGAGRRIEQYGFDLVGIGEHLFFHVPTSSSMVLLSAVAATTTRIQLLTSILILPLYPAAVVAKMAATLDRLSNERFNLGIGVGGEYAPEFQACEVDVSSRGRRTDRSLQFIRELWSGDAVQLPDAPDVSVTLQPAPSRPGGPPIWVAGRREPAIRHAARHGDFWYPYLYTPEMLADSVVTLRSMSDELRRVPTPAKTAAYVFVCCSHDRVEAQREVAQALGRGYSQDMDAPSRRYAAAGTPDDSASRIFEFVEAGASAVMIASACSPEHLPENLRLLGEEVLPLLRDRTAR